jgi:hypothetical protein
VPVTVGLDAYADAAFVDSYLETRHPDLFTTFSAASDEARDGAIAEATRYLDASFSWRGQLVDFSSQALGWPRYECIDHEGRYIDADHPLCDDLGIPNAVKQAMAVLAAVSLTNSLVATVAPGGQAKRIKVGPIEQEFFENAPSEVNFPFLRRMLTGLYENSRSSTRRLVRC